MRVLLLSILLFGFGWSSIAQSSKDSLIQSIENDTVVAFKGTAPNFYEQSVIIKYTGEAKLFFNELVAMHAQDPNAVERTPTTLYIPQSNNPYWVYGSYSVYANFQQKEDYAIIEIWFSAYNRPGNYLMVSAPAVYQKVVNRLLGK